MKKIVSLIVVLMIISVAILTGNVYAAPLNSVNVETSKDLVRPGEEVRVNIEFGQALGSYTFDIAYDNSIFEYVSNEGGTPNDMGDKVRGANVNSLLNAVKTNNMSTDDESEQVTVTGDVQVDKTGKVTGSASTGKTYKVEATTYTTGGLIETITITANT